jgi:hypothetical protein
LVHIYIIPYISENVCDLDHKTYESF